MTTITINDETVELTEDHHGLAGHIEIDGIRHRIYATVTPTAPPAVSPPKWRRR